ncbi:hypothetical protein P153DRAFT_373941 [Dothidotthia symphoricarpi CBS 119687]|uniref:Thioredoxin domain-containing protein n=1 Tax=Dothidotthia symphoricarpi CBS 119687 TaxID=1392245 RepID=A0A6A6AK01_9PLEO|nr:uncharacterized protein P153DRAFT_373941 [Dothidotthia symphoricarpi CBS 119687]KAF2132140.1 hypothetical protein P153DRAFT_373941 [Dothidotthia symphoricarpi CBS 119687]
MTERSEPLRLGSTAPNFKAETTQGPIDFHEFIGDKWVILFSHPEDYTPVCTTELGAFAKLEPEFTRRGAKLIGLSANTIDSHDGWIKDINEISGSTLKFPIIGDKERKVALAYDMIDQQDATNVDSKGIAFTIRSVFIIDPKKTIRLILSYPASTGRNTAEVLRVLDSLQTGDKHRITTPINWVPGDDVIVHPGVKNEEAKTLFPEFRIRPRTSTSSITSLNPAKMARQTPSNSRTNTIDSQTSTSGLSGLVCNVHQTTGREPHPLVGATTTILGDKLYVFGGRRLSRTRPQLTSDLYELDLVKRHWTKVDAKGDVPPARYFHSVCALGDTKLVCYGGMSPAMDAQPEVVVMSDIHIYDAATRTWMHVPTNDAPQGRYAHCATILPSFAVFTSTAAAVTAIRHNPSSTIPNQGSLGVQLDGEGGAEMVVVGGQDSSNHYIEQTSVFNLRSLKWTATSTLGRSCGAYRSVVAPLTSIEPNKIGAGTRQSSEPGSPNEQNSNPKGESSMLIYSNYNFLDVKLELQVRLPDGTLTEKPMQGNFSPPGLRFPNGGVINNHFVVSGTFLTSSKQEYALWALDLRTLSWGRIEAGGNIFSQGSWNRGVLWNRRNSFVILGNRKRSLVEDYNHRRINFSNICVVELEAFGLYDNPRKVTPSSGFRSVSAPPLNDRLDLLAGGRSLSPAATELGQMVLGMRELADMDFLAIHGERIPVNSHLIARRWGPYFNQMLRESVQSEEKENADTATLRPMTGVHPSRNSSITITPSIRTTYSAATTLTANTFAPFEATATSSNSYSSLSPPDPSTQSPSQRPRILYLPHTHLTLQALIHYLYTSSLPPQNSSLCTPQILCSLLQLARPYHIDGLLEAIIERLHVLLDNRNTAAIFNAAAMAAGGGSGVAFLGVNGVSSSNGASNGELDAILGATSDNTTIADVERSLDAGLRALRINTEVERHYDDEVSSAVSESTSASASDSGLGDGSGIEERETWNGEMSAVVGLQKRGLRGLMEGRRIREMGRGRDMPRDDGAMGNGDGVGLGLQGA